MTKYDELKIQCLPYSRL
uniref:Uncharacterized protein n=1 Tax=Anguilla anguilla TaxID=7936 RepID=A0A0E9PIU7_ANGAN